MPEMARAPFPATPPRSRAPKCTQVGNGFLASSRETGLLMESRRTLPFPVPDSSRPPRVTSRAFLATDRSTMHSLAPESSAHHSGLPRFIDTERRMEVPASAANGIVATRALSFVGWLWPGIWEGQGGAP